MECEIFDLWSDDVVTLPDGTTHTRSDCPEGVVLAPTNDRMSWHSNARIQGGVNDANNNGCGEKGWCGLPMSDFNLGGGWKLCFA